MYKCNLHLPKGTQIQLKPLNVIDLVILLLTWVSRTATVLAVVQPLLRVQRVPFRQAATIRKSTSYRPVTERWAGGLKIVKNKSVRSNDSTCVVYYFNTNINEYRTICRNQKSILIPWLWKPPNLTQPDLTSPNLT
jgi:hypothetical protein